MFRICSHHGTVLILSWRQGFPTSSVHSRLHRTPSRYKTMNDSIEKNGPSPGDYYKSWIAYAALTEAASLTSFKSVWSILACQCCPEPTCWRTQPAIELPAHLRSRIRWYDHVCSPSAGDGSPDASSSDRSLSALALHQLREHFVSHHQRIELILYALKPSLEQVYRLLSEQVSRNKILDDLTVLEAEEIITECQYTAKGWFAVTQLIQGVAKLDRMKYLLYVPSLAGVSGGNSPNMMSLTHKMASAESFFDNLSDQQLGEALYHRTPAGRVAEALIDCLDALSRCWFDHVVTATTAIGITRGTKGMPNTILVDRVLKRLHGSRLLKALGSLRTPITGIGVEMRQLYEYETYPLTNHYLNLFDDPGSEFGTHSIGYPPREFDIAKRDFSEIRRTKRTALWDHFYKETRPAFCVELKRLLGMSASSESIKIGLGSSVTEVLNRLVMSVRLVAASDMTVLLAENEFVTFQRAAAVLGQCGARIRQLSPEDFLSYTGESIVVESEEEKKDNDQVNQLVFVSLINSCTQRVMDLEWIHRMPGNTIIVVDITQAIANIPLDIEQWIQRPNVFFVGSLVKHARCGEGLGFLTFAKSSERLIPQPASGWTAFLSGLTSNKTTVEGTNLLMYDEGLEWDGGTPSFVESAYIATRVLKCLPSVSEQHEYVKTIKGDFLSRVKHLLSGIQKEAVLSDSNTLSIPVSNKVSDLPYGLDYKIVSGVFHLRIGFGIQNLHYHLDALVRILESSDALASDAG